MRILITGAAGFIGSHLSERFIEQGHEVIGVDNFITGTWQNLSGYLNHPRFTFVVADVVKPMDVEGPLDWILHFASPASPPKYQRHPIETLRSNAEGTYHLLDLAHRKMASLLFASSSEVYGDPHEHPQTERYWGHVNPIGPRSMYDEGKRYGEAMVRQYHETLGVNVRLIRIFNTYGPRMRKDDGRVIVNFIRQGLVGAPLTVYGDGSQTRSFQYVDDLIDAIPRVMAADYTDPINVGNPEEHSVLEVARQVREMTGGRSPIVFEPLPGDDPRQRRPDITLARRLLDWSPGVSLVTGLSRTIEHIRRVSSHEEAAMSVGSTAEEANGASHRDRTGDAVPLEPRYAAVSAAGNGAQAANGRRAGWNGSGSRAGAR